MGAYPCEPSRDRIRPRAWGGHGARGSLGVQARQVGPWIKTLQVGFTECRWVLWVP